MANENKQPLDAAVEATLEQAHQAIGRIAEDQADPTDEQ